MIDGHAHACGDLLRPEGILRILEANGVDQVVLVPGEHQSPKTYGLPNLARYFPSREVGNVTNAMTKVVVRVTGSARHMEEDNEFVFGLTRACPGRVHQFLWVMLHHGFERAAVGARYDAWRFKGLKVHQCWDGFDVRGTPFGALADFAVAHDLPVFIHLGSAAQAKALAEVASEMPDTVFIVGHLYGLEHFMRSPRPIPNVYFDFSCPDIVSDLRLKAALSHFGAARLILGSDSPYGRDNLARGIRRVRELDVSESDKDLMLGGNLARLLQGSRSPSSSIRPPRT
jgi:predicted TIM-barrel fold metal-dependent hydrolase